MKFTFESWMRAVWLSIAEPSTAARKLLDLNMPMGALWTGLALVAVLNVVLLALMQTLSPAPLAFEGQVITLSPFGLTAIIGFFMVLFVFAMQAVGRFFGGTGTLQGTLAVFVWFQAMSLTLEAVQLVLVLISAALGSLFGLLSLGALIWSFASFVNVLHGYNSIGKSIVTIMVALLGATFVAGMILTVIGLGPSGDLI